MKEADFVLEFSTKSKVGLGLWPYHLGFQVVGIPSSVSLNPEGPILFGIFFFTQAFQTLPLSCLVSPSRTVRN